MDIAAALLAGQSKRTTKAIVDYVGGDEKKFAELMSVFYKGDYRVQQCSAWPISVCAETHPELLKPYLKKLVDQLPRADVHDAVKRSVVRLLQYVEIPKRLQGKVYSLCVDLIDDPNEPIAVRTFAITVAARIAKNEPALLDELRLVVKQHLPRTTIAFKVRARKIL